MLCSKAPAWESILLGFPRFDRGLIAVAFVEGEALKVNHSKSDP